MSFLRSSLLNPLRLHFTRGYSPKTLDPSEMQSPQIHEIKKTLRRQGYAFKDPKTSSLQFAIPRHVLDPNSGLPSRWKDLDSSLLDVYVDKHTGRISIPSIPLSAPWRHFWSSLLKESPPLEPINPILHPQSPHLLAYNSAVPIENLPPEEFKRLLKTFKLSSKSLKATHFGAWGARLLEGHQLLFPVRLDASSIVGLRRLFIDPESKALIEDNLYDECSEEEEESGANDGILPFFHGLERIPRENMASQDVVFVSSVLDSLVLSSQSKDIIPIALAHGTRSLPPGHLPFFEGLSSIKIWFPNEEVRFWDSAFLFAKKLGSERTAVMSKELPQPYKCSQSSILFFKDAIRNKSLPVQHKYVTSFEGIREDVKLEFMNFEKCQGTQWKRFPELNELLKGFRRGELTVFSGRTGSGKTTFISEFSLDVCMRGINTLWGSFEVKNVRLAKMQMQQYALVNFEKNVEDFDQWADEFAKLPMYYLTFHGSNDVRLVLDAMLHSVYVYDIGHVIIDNIQFMMGTGNASKGGMDRLLQQDLIIEQFRKFATVHNVHVTLVIHPRKDMSDLLTTNSVFGGAKATQEADNVLFLQSECSEAISKQKKYLQIVKNRFSGDLGVIPLHFNKETLTFNKKTYKSEKLRKGNSSGDPGGGIPVPPGR